MISVWRYPTRRDGMNIGVDLKPFTTGSRFRGIGIFAKAIIEHIMELMPDAKFHYLNMYSGYNHDLPENDRCELHEYFTGPQITDVGERQLLRSAGTVELLEAEVKHFIKHSGIDVMLFTSPHEYGNLFKAEWFDGVATVGILYDLIPLIFPEQCLWDKTYSEDYYASLEFVKSLDSILTISESAKKDAVRLLEIPEDKIKVIYAGISPEFRKLKRINSKEIKKKYNIQDPFIMFAGGIDFKKNIELIIEAFSTVKAQYRNRYQFVVVGKMPQDLIEKFLNLANEKGVGGRVICTGFIPEEDLIALYNLTDMLVFPSLYEGFGLPVVEAMACGARVVTSDSSSLKEIAGDYATLVNPKSAKSIAKGITYVLDHPVQTLELAEKSISYAKGFTWDKVAAVAVDAIIRLPLKKNHGEYGAFTASEELFSHIAKEYAASHVRMESYIADTIAKQLVILEEDLSASCGSDVPRILFDLTVVREWIKAKYNTGIGRVSVELRRQLGRLAPLIPVAIENGNGNPILKRVDEITMDLTQEIISPLPGDIYFMPELQLKGIQVPENHPSTVFLREKGVKRFAILYDILPLIMPEYFEKSTPKAYIEYVKDILQNYDGVISISKASTDDLIQYYDAHIKINMPRPVKLGYFHLGMNSFKQKAAPPVPNEVESFFSDGSDVFLMVGTIEPRKGHEIVLDAFDELWEKGDASVSLCIIGHVGWNMDSFIKRIKNHPSQGKQLLYLEAAPDSYLQYAYNNASALIQASAGEGFGLPLIEAGQYGLPVICSDIPVFREVTAGHALFFDRGDAESLKKLVAGFSDMLVTGDVPDSSTIPMLTWEESTGILFGLISENTPKWYAQINTDGSVIYSDDYREG